MPLFGNTFSPKKTPPRRSASLSSLHTLVKGELRQQLVSYVDSMHQGDQKLDRSTREVELGLEYGPPVMNIGGQSMKFEEGQWITESGDNTSGREAQRLKKRNVQLEDENNLLKLKIEILMDMLTETTVEYHLMEKEVEDVKTHQRKK